MSAPARKLERTGNNSSGLTEPPLVRWTLTAVALAFLGLFLMLPLAAVFSQAFDKGVEVYLAALREPDTLASIKLTLITAAVAVPLNLVFGVTAAWAIAKFSFPGKQLLITLIDLPFSVSPVISGPDLRADLRAAGVAGAVAAGPRHEDHLCRAGHHPGNHLRHLPLRRPRADPADGGPGQGRGGGGPGARRQRPADLLPGDAAQHQVGHHLRRDPLQRQGHGGIRGRLGRLRPHPRQHQHRAAPRGDSLQRVQLYRRLCGGLAARLPGPGHSGGQDDG